MKKLFSYIYFFVLVIVVMLSLLSIMTVIRFPHNYRLFFVQSGSMEPAIQKGSLIIIQSQKIYKKGDIVTVKNNEVADLKNPQSYVTHRIVELIQGKGQLFYSTKGDANKSPDMNPRPSSAILGKVMYILPYIGYPIGFIKTQTGFIIFIVIPATLIIYTELINIKNEALRLIKERRQRKLTLPEKIEEKVGEEIIAVEKEIKKNINKVRKKKPYHAKKNS